MSLMRKQMSTSITTNIPADIRKEAVIERLHNHKMIVHLGGGVEDYKLDNGNEHMRATYSVTSRKWVGKTTFELLITNQNEGVDTEVTAHPPFGLLKIFSQWRVMTGVDSLSLVENVTIDGNRAMVGKIKGDIEKSHGQQHEKIIESARAEQAMDAQLDEKS